ncbi:MAG: polyphosphate kinase 1, partial [Candidatus Omnitrophota bacterium]
FANNLDEFFTVRYAMHKRLVDAQYAKKDSFGYYPHEIFDLVKTRTAALVKRAYDIYQSKILKELEKNQIFIRRCADLAGEQKRFVKKYFESTIFPIVTPMAVDQGRPFPLLTSRTIGFALNVSRYDKSYLATVPVPRSIPRLLRLPSEKDETSFVLIDDIIRENLEAFFKGYKIVESSSFRIMRDSEFSVDEEFATNLLKAINDEIRQRHYARPVSVELEKKFSPELLEALCAGLSCTKEETMPVEGDMDLTYLFEVAGQVSAPALLYPSFIPAKVDYANIFDKVKEGDLLVHLPFSSFQPTIDLIENASRDPNVLGIKMTLYRTNDGSSIIEALKVAARNKKQVTVLVEIKARFDEERNITWAKELEEAGCHVIYGFPNMKVHSKIALIVRREEEGIKRYAHLSTGNYNEKTARVYTDIGYFTANDDFCKDISEVFNVITGYSLPSRWKRIISSPNDLRQYFSELIDREIECQKKYKNGCIFAKMNSLEDIGMIEKLYEASCAGVKIKLLVRGICCLVPGVANLSENIEVRSVVGRFLEHSRIFLFNNNADYRVFFASADWMTRNLDRRIEMMFELSKEEIKEHLKMVLETYWKDNCKSRVLLASKEYARVEKEDARFNAQEYLIKHYTAQAV